MAEPVNETIAANALGPTSKPVGFRKIMMADEIPSDSGPSPSITPTANDIPNETRFPVPALHRLIEILQDDARSNMKAEPGHVCYYTCEAHECHWSPELTGLSMACSYFRGELYRRRLRKLVIKRDEDIQMLERAIPGEYRSAIRMICISPADSTASGWTESSLSLPRSLCIRLNGFIATCPNLVTFQDEVSGGRTSLRGLSVTSKTVRFLSIGYPFLNTKAGLPIVEAFPSASHLRIVELYGEFFESYSFGGESEGTQTTRLEQFQTSIEASFGQILPNVTTLSILLYAPTECKADSFKNASRKMPFPRLCKLFPNLTTVNLALHPTYVRDVRETCLLNPVIDSLRYCNMTLSTLTLTSLNFGLRRAPINLRRSEPDAKTGLDHFLLTKSAIMDTLAGTSSFAEFRYQHLEASGGRAICLKNIAVKVGLAGKAEGNVSIVEVAVDKDNLAILRKRSRRHLGPDSLSFDESQRPQRTATDTSTADGGNTGAQAKDTGTCYGDLDLTDLFAEALVQPVKDQQAGTQQGTSVVPQPPVEAVTVSRVSDKEPSIAALKHTFRYMLSRAKALPHKGLGEESGSARSCPPEKECPVGCSLHDGPWNADLTNLSSVCHALRVMAWRRRIQRILIRVDEDFRKLAECVKPSDRGFVREICIACTPRSSGAASLGTKFHKKLQAFMSTCTALVIFVDLNEADGPNTMGPSISHPGVVEIHLGLPCLSIQKTPFYRAFPQAEHLSLYETKPILFQSLQEVKGWKGVDAVQYLCSVFGDEVHSIMQLGLHPVMPNEVVPGRFKLNAGSMLFEQLCGRLPNLDDLRICAAVPFTQDLDQVCLMSNILQAISRSSTLVELTIVTRGTYLSRVRFATANMAAGKMSIGEDHPATGVTGVMSGLLNKGISFVDCLPSQAIIQAGLEAICCEGMMFSRFSYAHTEALEGAEIVVRNYGMSRGTTSQAQPSSSPKHWQERYWSNSELDHFVNSVYAEVEASLWEDFAVGLPYLHTPSIEALFPVEAIRNMYLTGNY